MAYERISDTKKANTGESLDAFVGNLVTLYKRQVSVRNAEDESRFNAAVLEDNLSLEDQLEYRKDQLKRVSDDPDERRRVRGEISNLKQRIEQEAFSDSYTEKLTDFQSGLISIDTVIQFLKDQQDSTDNETVLNAIGEKLADAQSTKFKLVQDLIKNQTEYATNSKTVSVIDTQIGKVSSYRAQALLSGNDQLVSMYDLQIQSLQGAKNTAQVQNDVLTIGTLSATGGYSAIAMLDALNAKIANSGSTGPLKIGDTTYASAKDFWTYKRDSYLTDSSSNGFFQSLNQELKNDLSVANSKNALTTDVVRNAANTFTTLSARPELQNFQRQVDLYKQDVLQTGANYITDAITNSFARNLDVSKAMNDIQSLRTLGVNVDEAFTKIMSSNAATKNTQVSNILSAAQAAMQNDPSLTPEAAIKQAVAAGAGTVLSPEQAANKTETQIATDVTKSAAAGAGTNDPRTTVAPTQPANTPQTSGNLNAATLTGLPNLTPGMRSDDVKTLQNYLIQQGYQIPAGATGFYGPETTAALAEFQKKNNIDTAGSPGYFGPRTKAFLTGSQTTTAPAPSPTPTTVQQPTPAPTPAPTPTPTPTPSPTPAPTQQAQPGYTFKKNGNLYEVYQNGQRIGTGAIGFAQGYGYTGQ